MPKKYTLSQYQAHIFSDAARQSLAADARPLNYPFTCPWQTAADPLAAHAAVSRGELPHDDRAETCTFCDQPAADLPTADWPMCADCFEAVAAPYPEELCDPLF